MEILYKICRKLDLGNLVEAPKPLTGGLMHKMYTLFTDKGRYAIKLLNPYVMKRETAAENYRIAEELENVLEENSIAIIPALRFRRQKMQEIEGQFFYLYEWYAGKALRGKEITGEHCRRIGTALAQIHKIQRIESPFIRSEIHINWQSYMQQIKGVDANLHALLSENLDLLCESQEKGNKAIKQIPPVVTICHNDMDSKNVLWIGYEFRIIDLECLSYSSPYMELFQMALRWSGYEECNIDFGLFGELISAYLQNGGVTLSDFENIYDSNFDRLEWLEYNLKRALGKEGDTCADQQLGVSEAGKTFAHIVYYHKAKQSIIEFLRNH